MAENNQHCNPQYLRDATGRHITGAIVDGELVKIVEGSKHMLRRHPGPGWATDAATLTIARTLGAVGVRVEDRETGRVYRASMATLDAHGERFNQGYGEQIALHLKHWQLQGAPVQAALFT